MIIYRRCQVRSLTHLSVAILIGAVAFPGWVGAASVTEEVRAPENEALAEVWGDPEEDAETEQTWTWFGMGYEQRTDMRNQQGAGGSSGDSGGRGGASTK
jgi:hypothetical protein